VGVDACTHQPYIPRTMLSPKPKPKSKPHNGHGRVAEVERLCAQNRLRMTGQRRVIIRVLGEAKDHPDADEVFARANAIDRGISLSTVYRTVKLLESKGILERHEFGHGRARYEAAARGHHDHLIDVASGRVIEFENKAIEKLQDEIARQHGYRLIGHRLELYGVALKPAKKP
jgi:Fur family transcriptional regulator, ferric uptake regulator